MPNSIRRAPPRTPDVDSSTTPPTDASALMRSAAALGPTRSRRGRRSAQTLAEATAGEGLARRRRPGGASSNAQTMALPRLPQGAAAQLAPPDAAAARRESQALVDVAYDAGMRDGAPMRGRGANEPMNQLVRSILSSMGQRSWPAPGQTHASGAPALSQAGLHGLDRSAHLLARPENVRVDIALSDVDVWYAKLPAASDVRLPQAQAADLRCPITFVPFAEMTHPVAVYAGQVVHVFEAADLLTWMQSSMQLEARFMPMATNPLDRKPLALHMLKRAVVDPGHP